MSDKKSKEAGKKPTYEELLLRIKKHREELIAPLTSTMDSPGIAENISLTLQLNDGSKLPVEIFRLINSKLENYPTIFHIPGSGFNTLNPYFAFVTCSQLAEHSGCQVIVINHRLVPEHPFPTGQNDALEVFSTLMENASPLKIDSSKVALSGYSSGGTYAAWMANQMDDDKKGRGLSSIKQLFLISPVVDLSGLMPRTEKESEMQDNIVSQRFVDGMMEYYLHGITDTTDPNLSPYLQPEIKKGHAQTHLIRGSRDRLASDTENYGKKLKEKTMVTSKIIEGCHDVFWHNIETIRNIARVAKDTVAISIPRNISMNTETQTLLEQNNTTLDRN